MIKDPRIKKWIYFSLLLGVFLTTILQHDYEQFLSQSFAKTSFDWKKNEVECLKEMLADDALIPFRILEGGVIITSEPFRHFSHQYMFAPVILQRNEVVNPRQLILLLDEGSLKEAEALLPGYQSRSTCSDDLILFTRKEQP